MMIMIMMKVTVIIINQFTDRHFIILGTQRANHILRYIIDLTSSIWTAITTRNFPKRKRQQRHWRRATRRKITYRRLGCDTMQSGSNIATFRITFYLDLKKLLKGSLIQHAFQLLTDKVLSDQHWSNDCGKREVPVHCFIRTFCGNRCHLVHKRNHKNGLLQGDKVATQFQILSLFTCILFHSRILPCLILNTNIPFNIIHVPCSKIIL